MCAMCVEALKKQSSKANGAKVAATERDKSHRTTDKYRINDNNNRERVEREFFFLRSGYN